MDSCKPSCLLRIACSIALAVAPLIPPEESAKLWTRRQASNELIAALEVTHSENDSESGWEHLPNALARSVRPGSGPGDERPAAAGSPRPRARSEPPRVGGNPDRRCPRWLRGSQSLTSESTLAELPSQLRDDSEGQGACCRPAMRLQRVRAPSRQDGSFHKNPTEPATQYPQRPEADEQAAGEKERGEAWTTQCKQVSPGRAQLLRQ